MPRFPMKNGPSQIPIALLFMLLAVFAMHHNTLLEIWGSLQSSLISTKVAGTHQGVDIAVAWGKQTVSVIKGAIQNSLVI